MLVSEAVQLVLQAAAIAKGGECFVLDMGEAVKIKDLAQKMLLLSGKPHLPIVIMGLRRGEKLYEELLIDKKDAKTKYKSIFVAQSPRYSLKKLNSQIKKLLNSQNVAEILRQIVPEFRHNDKGW